MTIGIGVLCCTKPKIPKFTLNPEKQGPRPDALVMIADTMGSCSAPLQTRHKGPCLK